MIPPDQAERSGADNIPLSALYFPGSPLLIAKAAARAVHPLGAPSRHLAGRDYLRLAHDREVH
jgi:hypothetical protein